MSRDDAFEKAGAIPVSFAVGGMDTKSAPGEPATGQSSPSEALPAIIFTNSKMDCRIF